MCHYIQNARVYCSPGVLSPGLGSETPTWFRTLLEAQGGGGQRPSRPLAASRVCLQVSAVHLSLSSVVSSLFCAQVLAE